MECKCQVLFSCYPLRKHESYRNRQEKDPLPPSSLHPPLLIYTWFVGKLQTLWPFVCSEQPALRCLWLPHGRAQRILRNSGGLDTWWTPVLWMVPVPLIRKPWTFPSISETEVTEWTLSHGLPGCQACSELSAPPCCPCPAMQCPILLLPFYLIFPISHLVEVLQVLRQFTVVSSI